jgi:DNA polymerase III delta subunit
MLVVFYGTDRTKVRNAAYKETEVRDSVPTILDETSYTPGLIASSVGANSLFGGVECYLLDTPSSNPEFEAEVMGSLAALAESENIFIVLEGALLAESKKKYAKHAAVIGEFLVEKIQRFNPFSLAEALARKDKKQLWVLLQQARMADLRDEEMVGILWWQLKTLRLAAGTNSPEAAGVKEYPYKKAKQALRNFAAGELEALSSSLLSLYHEDHQGLAPMETSLERWVLSV